jgi:hypothetical protein
MTDVDVTELTTLEATKVSGVARAANGTPFLVIKAQAEKEDCPTCKGKGTIMAGNRKCPDCKGTGEVAKAEADEIEDELTGDAAKALEGACCGDVACEVCGAAKAKLSAADREALPASSFAFVDKKGGKHLPVHDPGHTKSALGRFGSQDFSEAKGDPADAKKKAAGKILSAAKKHGIEVDDSSEVAEAAKKGAIQDALNGTQEPKEAGHLATGHSGTSGSVTAGTRAVQGDASLTLGGQTTSVIPDEAKVTNNPPIPATTDPRGIVDPEAMRKGFAVASLVDALDRIGEQRQAIKDGRYLQVANPTGAESASPGSMPWESYDSATLAQVAQCLAGCCNALDAIQQREAIEAASGNPGDYQDAWDLDEASQALEYAMGVAARLAFQEAAEGDAAKEQVEKAGRTLNSKNEQALRTARDHLNAVLQGAEDKKAGDAGTSEEDKIVTEVTKTELAESIASASAAAAVEAVKQIHKQEKKAAKKAVEAAAKNANNGGDISEADIKPTGQLDADNINGIPGGGDVDGQYVNKGAEDDPVLKQVQDQLGELTKDLKDRLGSVEEMVTKIAKRPRPGGPSLDGQARIPAAEGRQGDVAKGVDDAAIEALEKSFEEETDPVRKGQLGEQLTREKLYRVHSIEFGTHAA